MVLAPPSAAPKKLNTELSYSAIPRPSSATHTSGASSSNYSTALLDMASFVPKYTMDPRYADNINVAENMVKELCIDSIPSDKNTNSSPSNFYRNNLYSNVKTDNLTVASNYSSPYYSPPLELSRYYSQTPNMYQIVPESNSVLYTLFLHKKNIYFFLAYTNTFFFVFTFSHLILLYLNFVIISIIQ